MTIFFKLVSIFLFVCFTQLYGSAYLQKETNYERDVLPLLEKYCYQCHGDGAKKGQISLDFETEGKDIINDEDLWKKVWENVYRHNMPPANKTQCKDSEIDLILNWIEEDIFGFDLLKEDLGRLTIRRLNRSEYKNTIRDLFGVEIEVRDFFPPDDTGYGFDTIGEVLTLSPLLMEKYMEMADIVLSKAFGPKEDSIYQKRFSISEMEGGIKIDDFRVLPSAGKIFSKVRIPYPGKYSFTIEASASRAGNELAKLGIKLAGKFVDFAQIDAEYPSTKKYTFEFDFKDAKEVSFAIHFLNDYYDPNNSNRRLRDRNLYIRKLDVSALDFDSKNLKQKRKLFHNGIADEGFTEKTVERILEDLLPKIFRRPIAPSEVKRYIKLFRITTASNVSSFYALQVVLKAALVSPHFLFREEYQPEKNNPLIIYKLDDYTLASRLSYFLWSSTPDERLMQLAKEKRLSSNLNEEVVRMIQNKKSDSFIENFAGQWLQIRDLDLAIPDQKRFPLFTSKLRESMRKETESFFAYILRENRSVFEFIQSNYVFVNQSMADFYNLDGQFGNQFEKVVLSKKNSTQRGGFLTQASILTVTSNATRTSPVKRGRWILDNILGAPPKDPPPGIAELEDFQEHNSDNLSIREQMAIHSRNVSCSSCHANMDAMGYTMEKFDAIGTLRNFENGKQIDSRGQLGSGEKLNGVQDLKTFIIKDKTDAFLNCLAEKLLTYAVGRGMEYYDRRAIKEIISRTKKEGNGFRDLIINVIKSKPFLLRKGG